MTDILADIDATVDGRCACGCGVLLASDGPSGWFAAPECQTRFQARDATDPLAVWLRPDAAAVYPCNDGRRVPLSEPGPLADRMVAAGVQYQRLFDEHIGPLLEIAAAGIPRAGDLLPPPGQAFDPRPHLQPGLAEAAQRHQEQWSQGWERLLRLAERVAAPQWVVRLLPPEPPSTWDREAERRIRAEEGWESAELGFGPLAWFRWCDRCGRSVQPRTGLVPAPVTWISEPMGGVVTPSLGDVGQYCPRCHARWPGPLLVAQWRWREEDRAYSLRLSAPGWSWATHCLAIGDAGDEGIVAYVWGHAERALLDALTFRAPCTVGGCGERARAWFRVGGRVDVASEPGMAFSFVNTDVGLCPRHERDLLRVVVLR